jgi:chromosome segregation ATPase
LVEAVNQENNVAEPEAGTGSEDRLSEVENQLVQAKTHLAELEQTVASRDNEIAGLKQSKGEVEARVHDLNRALTEAVVSYRAMVVQANPEIEALVSGDTIEAINQAVSQAKALVSKVRQGLEAEISLTRIPAGAPERTVSELSLSPREKIQAALAGRTK